MQASGPVHYENSKRGNRSACWNIRCGTGKTVSSQSFYKLINNTQVIATKVQVSASTKHTVLSYPAARCNVRLTGGSVTA